MAEATSAGGRPRISAFTFLRNGVRFCYPFVGSIRSALGMDLSRRHYRSLGEGIDAIRREPLDPAGDAA